MSLNKVLLSNSSSQPFFTTAFSLPKFYCQKVKKKKKEIVDIQGKKNPLLICQVLFVI